MPEDRYLSCFRMEAYVMELKEMSIWDYLLLPGPAWHTGLSDYYISNSKSIVIFGLTNDGVILSYAIIMTDFQMPILAFILTDPEQRRRGFAACLLRLIMHRLNSGLECRIQPAMQYYPEMNGLMLKLGASASLSSRVYSASVNERLWARMSELKMSRLKDLVLRGGGKCGSFQQFDTSIKDQLFASPFSAFHNSLNPNVFQSDPHVDWKLSSAMIRNGQLCAYTLITRQGSQAVCFEQIAESSDTVGTGAVIAPLYTSLEAIRVSEPAFKLLNLQILNDNHASRSFVISILQEQRLQIKDTYSYRIPAPR